MDAKNTHNMEQAAAALRDIAISMGSYYKNLVDAGFSEEQAFELVSAYHYNMLSTITDFSRGEL